MMRTRRWRRAVVLVVLAVFGAGLGTAWAVYTATTSNGPNTFSSAPEYTAPTVSRATTQNSGGLLNVIRQGGGFYFYVNVTDASGVASVTVDTGSFLLGTTYLSSAGGPWTVNGQTYNFRSSLLTALTGLITGTTQNWTVTAVDIYGNSTGALSFSVTIQTYSNVVTTTTGLAGYWRMDDANPTMVNQVGTDGSYNGFWLLVTWTAYPTLGVTGALAGDTSTAVYFDGTSGDYATTANRPIQDDFSIELWFKANGAGSGSGAAWWGYSGLVDADESFWGNNDFGTSYGPDGKVRAGVGPSDTTLVSPSSYNDGAWHQVVFTRTKATGALVLYVDGAQVATGTGGTQSLNSPSDIRFGGIRTGGPFFKGSIDEVAAYTTVLGAATVLDHYKAGTGTG
jgi:hypothetical protein